MLEKGYHGNGSKEDKDHKQDTHPATLALLCRGLLGIVLKVGNVASFVSDDIVIEEYGEANNRQREGNDRLPRLTQVEP